MIISSATDFREAARRKLPPFLFHYLDGGAGAEQTLRANVDDLQAVKLRQRVLRGSAELDVSAEWFGERYGLPVALAPVGLAGMYARRGEVQAARAACHRHIPFIQSTVSVCPLSEVAAQASKPIWFQLYVLKDRAFMRDVMRRAWELGARNLVFTVDMPVPGNRYRDLHSGMSGPDGPWRRVLQGMLHPRWAWDVGLHGRPHDLGNISTYRGHATGLADYIGWLGENFDPGIAWNDLQWIRDEWQGKLIIKGILDPDDARDALKLGAVQRAGAARDRRRGERADDRLRRRRRAHRHRRVPHAGPRRRRRAARPRLRLRPGGAGPGRGREAAGHHGKGPAHQHGSYRRAIRRGHRPSSAGPVRRPANMHIGELALIATKR